jgi:hypothetical protein
VIEYCISEVLCCMRFSRTWFIIVYIEIQVFYAIVWWHLENVFWSSWVRKLEYRNTR